jgi:hypothetical protein
VNEDELRRRMYGPKLRVVPDPLAFPQERGVIGGVPWRPWMQPTILSSPVADMSDKMQKIVDEVDDLMRKLQAGMITIAEARAKMMGQ